MANKLALMLSGLKSVRSIRKAYRNNFKSAPRPFELHFETTYLCTCKCVFCNRWAEGPKRVNEELDYNQIISMINQAYELGVRIIILSGGEPLLKKDILKAMQCAKKKGMITSVTHNGTLITDKNLHEILSSFSNISISIDSMNSEVHDRIRGAGSGTHKKAMHAIRLLNKHAKNSAIHVQSVVTAHNITDILEINKEFFALGIPTSFQPIHDELDNSFMLKDKSFVQFNEKSLRPQWEDLLKNYSYSGFIERLVFKKYYARMADFMINPTSTKECFTCYAGSCSMTIDPYGNVYPCDALRKSMGNIKEQSLIDIWNNKESQNLRRSIKYRNCHCWLMCNAPMNIHLTKYC